LTFLSSEFSRPCGNRKLIRSRFLPYEPSGGQLRGLYGHQQEALAKWNSIRDKDDILFSLPTGGGKTLVGLLAAQSLVNERKGKVLYACPTKQLVEQARLQAEQCGIQVATYCDSRWHNQELFQQAHCCLVTNYHVLFNGKSRFKDERIHGVIFDDAHVAPQVIRDCFTLRMDRTHPAWYPVLQILQTYFQGTSFYSSFRKIQTPGQGYEQGLLFVPAWFVAEHTTEISAALEDNGVSEQDSTKFAYPHLRLHLSLCCFFLAQDRLEIGPTVLPTHTLPYFQAGVRRLYMTATLPSRYDCIRTFGADRAEPIVPSGKAGAAQRLFVFAKGQDAGETTYEEVRRLTAKRKACIIVPSGNAGNKWLDIAKLYESKDGHAAIREFAEATDGRKLVLAAIYDGIDLPGKSCKVLVLDGVPRGASLHDQFIEGPLDVAGLKASSIATRIVQSIGRIFRSNTDHGVVILADRFQQEWLIGPDHLPLVPQLLQQQIQLGFEIRKLVDQRQVTYEELMASVIDGRDDWDRFYNTQMAMLQAQRRPKEPDWSDDLAKGEFEAFRHLWDGRYEQAAGALASLAQVAEKREKNLSAWLCHWAGLAFTMQGDVITGRQLFQRAASVKNILGRVSIKTVNQERPVPGPQATLVAGRYSPDYASTIQRIAEHLAGDGGPNAELHEQALMDLGELLGFLASRPDKQTGTGPDVLWSSPDLGVAIDLEAKSQKRTPRAYKKRDIGKLHDDWTWLDINAPNTERRITIVGPFLQIVKQANPRAEYRITPLPQFQDLANRAAFAYQTVAAACPKKADLAHEIELAFRFSGLLWPTCIDGLDFRFASDLQGDADDNQVPE
jgi:hypothetical protein